MYLLVRIIKCKLSFQIRFYLILQFYLIVQKNKLRTHGSQMQNNNSIFDPRIRTLPVTSFDVR